VHFQTARIVHFRTAIDSYTIFVKICSRRAYIRTAIPMQFSKIRLRDLETSLIGR